MIQWFILNIFLNKVYKYKQNMWYFNLAQKHAMLHQKAFTIGQAVFFNVKMSVDFIVENP